MPTLRDGTEALDPRLTRLPWFDPKSWEYKVRDLFTKDKPLRSKHWKCATWLDQGSEGACTGFAVGHELVAEPVSVPGIDNDFCREKLYWEAQKIDRWDGGAYPGADPFMEGSSVLAAMKVAKREGFITEYRWAFGVEDVKKALSQIVPVVIGVPWYAGMFKPSPCGHLHPTGEKVGGHAACLVGIKVRKKTVVLHNSWGKKWGKNGRAEIHWDDLHYLLKKGGEACVPLVRKRG
jgi:hypothetical protein